MSRLCWQHSAWLRPGPQVRMKPEDAGAPVEYPITSFQDDTQMCCLPQGSRQCPLCPSSAPHSPAARRHLPRPGTCAVLRQRSLQWQRHHRGPAGCQPCLRQQTCRPWRGLWFVSQPAVCTRPITAVTEPPTLSGLMHVYCLTVLEPWSERDFSRLQ